MAKTHSVPPTFLPDPQVPATGGRLRPAAAKLLEVLEPNLALDCL
jgi:hypothetical protein